MEFNEETQTIMAAPASASSFASTSPNTKDIDMALQPEATQAIMADAAEADKVNLHVKTLTGKDFIIKAEATWTIAKLKEEIGIKESIHPSQQKLVYKGKQLSIDEQTLGDCGIKSDDTLHLGLALRGGGNL